MPPSDRAKRTSGNLWKTRDQSRSDAACTRFTGCSVIITLMGASAAVMIICDDDPMCRQTTVPVSEQAGPERVPVVAVEARASPRLLGVLGERDGVAALGRHPADLGGHELGVPDGGDGQRDEPAGLVPAPLVDVPVVVGPDHGQGHVLVLGAAEELAAELRERREAHRAEDAVGVHVGDAGLDVVATVPHLGEGGRVDAVLVGRPAGDGVQPDVGQLLALVEPDVVARRVLDGLGRQVLVPLGQVLVEHARWLDHVVVHADQDQVLDVHGVPLVPAGRTLTAHAVRRGQRT